MFSARLRHQLRERGMDCAPLVIESASARLHECEGANRRNLSVSRNEPVRVLMAAAMLRPPGALLAATILNPSAWVGLVALILFGIPTAQLSL